VSDTGSRAKVGSDVKKLMGLYVKWRMSACKRRRADRQKAAGCRYERRGGGEKREVERREGARGVRARQESEKLP